MTGVVEFLNARLDGDEAAAVRAARPEPWVKSQPPRPDWYVQFWADEQDRAAVIADPESSAYPIVTTLGYDGGDEADDELAEGRVEHIARHNPARVLREVAAKRAIVKFCDNDPLFLEGGYAYTNCVLRLLAMAYDDHPDYEQAWRIDT